MYQKSFQLIGWSFRWCKSRQNAANETETIVSDKFFNGMIQLQPNKNLTLKPKTKEKKNINTHTFEQLNLCVIIIYLQSYRQLAQMRKREAVVV